MKHLPFSYCPPATEFSSPEAITVSSFMFILTVFSYIHISIFTTKAYLHTLFYTDFFPPLTDVLSVTELTSCAPGEIQPISRFVGIELLIHCSIVYDCFHAPTAVTLLLQKPYSPQRLNCLLGGPLQKKVC